MHIIKFSSFYLSSDINENFYIKWYLGIQELFKVEGKAKICALYSDGNSYALSWRYLSIYLNKNYIPLI